MLYYLKRNEEQIYVETIDDCDNRQLAIIEIEANVEILDDDLAESMFEMNLIQNQYLFYDIRLEIH